MPGTKGSRHTERKCKPHLPRPFNPWQQCQRTRPAESTGWEENPACRGKGLGESFRVYGHLLAPAGYAPAPWDQLQGILEAFKWSHQAPPILLGWRSTTWEAWRGAEGAGVQGLCHSQAVGWSVEYEQADCAEPLHPPSVASLVL